MCGKQIKGRTDENEVKSCEITTQPSFLLQRRHDNYLDRCIWDLDLTFWYSMIAWVVWKTCHGKGEKQRFWSSEQWFCRCFNLSKCSGGRAERPSKAWNQTKAAVDVKKRRTKWSNAESWFDIQWQGMTYDAFGTTEMIFYPMKAAIRRYDTRSRRSSSLSW